MSIGFSFTGKVRRTETLIGTARTLSQQRGYQLFVGETDLRVALCPLGGDVYVSWKREGGVRGQWLIQGSCSSTPAGAGLHKAAVELLDALGIQSLSVDDETEYYDHRDFQRMKQEHFYPWVKTLVRFCREQKDLSGLRLCWDMDQYQPEDLPGSVVTPMGRFTLSYLESLLEREGAEGLAQIFFLWDGPDRDAVFYRNRAVNGLWENCYFAPSSRSEEDAKINAAILDDLERSASLDPGLPLPRKAYREVCALAGRPPVLPEGPELEADFPIGYRRGLVVHSLGQLQLTLPGSYQYEWEEWEDKGGTNLWCDAAVDSPVWRVNGYRRREGNASFTPHLDGLKDLEEAQLKNGAARWGWQTIQEGKSSYFQIQCEVVTGPSLFYITVTYTQAREREDILSLLRRLSVAGTQKIETHTIQAQEE